MDDLTRGYYSSIEIMKEIEMHKEIIIIYKVLPPPF